VHGVLHGMVVDPTSRLLFFSDPAAGVVRWLAADSGQLARSARAEYPIFSSALPSFEYSIYECASVGVFATGLDEPSGLALAPPGVFGSDSPSGSGGGAVRLLFVAEHGSGSVAALDVSTGAMVKRYAAIAGMPAGRGLQGLAFGPATGALFATHADSGTLLALAPAEACSGASDGWIPYLNESVAVPDGFAPTAFPPVVATFASAAAGDPLGAVAACVADASIPNASYYAQVGRPLLWSPARFHFVCAFEVLQSRRMFLPACVYTSSNKDTKV